ncbi:hypothetical protein [Anaerosinus massiliensis]|uniref:hypothetical protein n=1 Tax=Massilibacillus massiliensis TaxID=1806837 RepID=UPI000DA61CC6|nr:hypothetical protein [Massilibacillus massiliensis]
MEKKFIKVIAEHYPDGAIRPVAIDWDGRNLSVDKILDIRQAASLKCGGQGTRYTCKICGKAVYLFCDDGRWFMDK